MNAIRKTRKKEVIRTGQGVKKLQKRFSTFIPSGIHSEPAYFLVFDLVQAAVFDSGDGMVE